MSKENKCICYTEVVRFDWIYINLTATVSVCKHLIKRPTNRRCGFSTLQLTVCTVWKYAVTCISLHYFSFVTSAIYMYVCILYLPCWTRRAPIYPDIHISARRVKYSHRLTQSSYFLLSFAFRIVAVFTVLLYVLNAMREYIGKYRRASCLTQCASLIHIGEPRIQRRCGKQREGEIAILLFIACCE